MRKSHDQTAVARQVRTLFQVGAVGHFSDRELLERFATQDGFEAEIAFEALVERHGPMVLRACQSTLRDPHEAQDAFQNTFLLLARRAGSLWVRDSLGPWLHSVACRTANGGRVAEARRRALERRIAGRLARTSEGPPRDDLSPALHEEIDRLPERLKAPVILCHLEGLTHEMAAEHLNCPVGTVRSRLSRGRDRLRRALTRRGFAPLPTDSHSNPLPALPAGLASFTIHAARLAVDRSPLHLLVRCSILVSEGVLQPMMTYPLKSAAAILLASGALAIGLGSTSGQVPKPPDKMPEAENPAREPSAIDRRFEALERRVQELEQKQEEVASSRRATPRSTEINVRDSELKPEYVAKSRRARIRLAEIDQNTLIKIRPRFDKALVEKVYVDVGESVKKGDPILRVQSVELGAAKNQCRTNFVQWDHDHKYLIAREPLFKESKISRNTYFETQNDEKKSRLDYLVSREKLASYGMTNEQIDNLIEGLSDDRQKPLTFDDTINRMTVVSPIDGIIVDRNALAGNFYDQTNVLLQITPPKP